MSRTSPIHHRHERLGARFTDFGGWSMPLQYDSVVAEHLAVRNAVGWFDVTHLGRFALSGGHAESAISAQTTIDATTVEPGTTRYGLVLNQDGGIADDIVIWRTDGEEFIVLPNAANHHAVMGRFSDLDPVDLRETTVMLAIQGPDAPDLLDDLTGFDGPRFTVERRHDAIVAGTGYTGERGGEVIIANEDVEPFMDSLISRDPTPAGLGARDTLRLEAGLPLWGNDMGPDISPYRAGLGFAVDLDHEFVGREALDPDERSERILVATGSRRIPRPGNALLNSSGDVVGEITSGTFSPVREEGIAMGRSTDRADTIAVDIRGTSVPVTREIRSFL